MQFLSSQRKLTQFRRAVTAAATVLVAANSLTAVAPAAQAQPRPDVVQQGIDQLVGPERHPGALAAVRDRSGRTRHYTAGTGDLRTGAKVPIDGEVRIGSASKMFAAVVVLQLVAEGKVDLDASVEKYLPGLVHGRNVDASRITVWQLLQHDSGLPDYTDTLFTGVGDLLKHRDVYFEPRELLDLANAREDGRPSGGGWSYSNTNYVLAGMIAQRVTGRPFNELVTTRIIQRIGLRHTYAPAVGESDLRGKHPQGYQLNTSTGRLDDITRIDTSWGWAAGQLVSTPGDLNAFLRALLDGKLLAPAQLDQMRTTIPLAQDAPADTGYGLGVFRIPLSCGGVAWGHGGDITGFSTVNGATEDGRAATVVVTSLTGSVKDPSVAADRSTLLDTALCGS